MTGFHVESVHSIPERIDMVTNAPEHDSRSRMPLPAISRRLPYATLHPVVLPTRNCRPLSAFAQIAGLHTGVYLRFEQGHAGFSTRGYSASAPWAPRRGS